jgi:outer membrane protein assembly factor BamB
MKRIIFGLELILLFFAINMAAYGQESASRDTVILPNDIHPTFPNASSTVYLPLILHQDNSWPMVAANLQRTSWSAEQVSGILKPIWYRALGPYIPRKFQIIAANGGLFISTAKGLYALNASDGSLRWIYPTALPLGNAPTFANGYLYVGGYDRRIHAVDARTGTLKPGWILYEAQAGFETNPLVIDGMVYAGNRDGSFYALDAANGTLKWKYQTGGPILFSAAYKDNTLYFASNDSYAYALNASSGALVWKSARLPGAGFHSWWPVVWDDYVIFAGSNNYRVDDAGWTGDIGYENSVTTQELYNLFPNAQNENRNTLIGARGSEPYRWVSNTVTFNNARTVNYYETYPGRRTTFVLKRSDGSEYTFDSNGNQKPEYAPFSWAGVTHSGNRYPPVVGRDNVLYQTTLYRSDPYIGGVGIVGWKFGTPFMSIITSFWEAADEPEVWSAGGNLIYMNLCCDRQTIVYDISRPNTSFPTVDRSRDYDYYAWDLEDRIPGYNTQYWQDNGIALFGNVNGVYGDHGVQNPAIPYQGKVFMHRGNSVIAWGNYSGTPTQYPSIPVSPASSLSSSITRSDLVNRLTTEVSKIINAPGLLRPGYHHTGLYEAVPFTQIGPNLSDYFHNPADTVITLIRALPYLSPALQDQTKVYLQRWTCRYPLQTYAHTGWKSGTYSVTCSSVTYTGSYGTPREAFETPVEIADQMASYGPTATEDPVGWNNTPYWKFPPMSFYGMWKYSQVFGNAKVNFEAIKNRRNDNSLPSDSYLITYPYILNAYLSGYYGYMQLEKMAGDTTEVNQSSLYSTYQWLLQLRINNFSKDTPFIDPSNINDYRRVLNIARNYMYITPELAAEIRSSVLSKVQAQVDEIDTIAPYWFVSKYDSTRYEGELQQLYDYGSVFQARALILQEPYDILVNYLDTPAFERGDLFYIDNLVAALEKSP